MYKSRYNIEVEGEDGELLLFNTANGAFAVIRGDARDVYDTYVEGDDLFPSMQITPGKPLADALVSDGFLTLLDSDEELELQRQRFDAARSSTRELALCIAPSYRCNQACPYCYERKLGKGNDVMSAEVQDAVVAYMEDTWKEHPFQLLTIQWYGGEPSLCLDVVEKLSERMIAFCDAREVVYDALMLSNCAMLDSDESVEALVRCQIQSVIVTIDGHERTHNARRLALDGGNSYTRAMSAVGRMRDRGILVHVLCNVDKNNWDEFQVMQEELAQEGISCSPGKLNDYYKTFGSDGFDSEEYDFFTHEEFARVSLEKSQENGMSLYELRSKLSPCSHFCRGQLDCYMVVDAFGDVYKCDGWMGYPEHFKFNILDGIDQEAMRQITLDATRDAQCSRCNLLPICQGNCYWERRCSGMPCHPLKLTIDDYLHEYRKIFGNMGTCEYITVTRPLSDEEIAAT